MKIRKNDNIIVIAGKDRGKKGKVMKAFPAGRKVVVEGVNIVKKHVRTKKQGQKGQKVEIPAPISVSNVKLICSKCGFPTRIGYKVAEKNKFRICKKCQSEI